MGLLALLFALQQPQLTVTTTVDRPHVQVGDEIVYSLRAVGAAVGTFSVALPVLSGLPVIDRTEHSERTADGGRAYSVELRLRAAEVGVWQFSPVVVTQGDESAVAPEVEITVVGSNAPDAQGALTARLLDLIRSVPSPDGSGARIMAVASANHVFPGEQVDLLTAAWFPRSLRNRLRRPPAMTPPVLDGVWSVPQASVPGIVSSRFIGDETFDLFVNHQVVYPLAPGRLVIPWARLSYSVPVGRPSAGQERTVSIVSDSVFITVDALPDKGRPDGFTGPVARDLRVTYRVERGSARAGELLPVDLVVAGQGNMTLWTPPNLDWPAGTRAYPDKVEEVARPTNGMLGGTKTFRFLILPDSAGSLAFPPLRYAYFDPETAKYREAAAPGIVVPVLEAIPHVVRAEVLHLVGREDDWSYWLHNLEPSRQWWWIALFAGPVALVTIVEAIRRRRWRGRRAARRQDDPVAALERLATTELISMHAPADWRLDRALRQHGVSRETAARLADLKERVDAERYGDERVKRGDGLVPDIRAALAALPKRISARLTGPLLLLIIAGVGAAAAIAQTGDAVALYRSANYAAAGERFETLAKAHPNDWTRWYNLAAAEYMAGHDAATAAALFRAKGLAPRAAPVRELWRTVEREHEPLREAPRPFPLSLGERWLAVVAVCWLWALVAVSRGAARRSAVIMLGAAAVVALVAIGFDTRARLPAGFLDGAATLRVSPHGLAPEKSAVPALSYLELERSEPGWWLVRDRRGQRGWVAAKALVPARD
ncbi:MAG: hypothetical protein ABI647_22675 [Gemmatimonadota bacterium]